MTIEAKHHKVAGQFSELLVSKLANGRAVHSETVISSAARLAGSLLFRSFNFDTSKMTSGSAILSNEPNEKGTILVNIAGGMLSSFGISIDQSKIGTFSDLDKCSNLTVLDTQRILVDDALAILKNEGLSLEDGAYSAAMTTGWLIKECSPQIGAEKGFNIAVYGFIEGTKTVPYRSIEAQVKSPEKAWYKFW